MQVEPKSIHVVQGLGFKGLGFRGLGLRVVGREWILGLLGSQAFQGLWQQVPGLWGPKA